eukprot:11209351-Lingulodinium_polyedra.AAC.1
MPLRLAWRDFGQTRPTAKRSNAARGTCDQEEAALGPHPHPGTVPDRTTTCGVNIIRRGQENEK